MQGIVVIYDIGGVTTSHTLMMTPAIMKKHVVVFQVGINIILLLPDHAHDFVLVMIDEFIASTFVLKIYSLLDFPKTQLSNFGR